MKLSSYVFIYAVIVSVILGVMLLNPKQPNVTHVKPIVTTVTSNVYIPIYRTKYVTTTVTINNTIVDYITITSQNAIERANNFQKDLISFERLPLSITMSEYDIIDNIPPKYITMDAQLHYRTWKLLVTNNYKQYKDNPLYIDVQYGLDRGKISIGVNKEVTRLFGFPILLGINKEL